VSEDPLIADAGALPLYRRIAERIRRAILRGDYVVGDRLPSVRGLAVEEDVNPNTVQTIYDLLEDEGWIERHPGVGAFVRGGPRMSRPARRAHIGKRLLHARFEARRLGADRADWNAASARAERECDLAEKTE
jgi:GntR family transcriptional regulator